MKQRRKNKRISELFYNKENRKTIFEMAGICILMLAIFVSFAYIYTNELHRMVENESYEYLNEITTQMDSNLNKEIKKQYSTLSTLGNKVEQNIDTWQFQDILNDLDHEKNNYQYQQIALVDENGTWHSYEKTYIITELLPYIAEMNSSNKDVTTNIINIQNTDGVIFLHPLNIQKNDTNFVAIASFYNATNLSEQFSLSLFNDQGYTHIVTQNGNIVIRSENENTHFHGYNIFTYLDSAEIEDDISIDQIKKDFMNGTSRKIQYQHENGQSVMAIYTPSEYENWYLFAVIPSELLSYRSYAFYQLTLVSCVVIASTFLILVVIIFIIQLKKKRELLEILYTDNITEGCSMSKFTLDVKELLKRDKNKYTIIYANVNRFKTINQQLGRSGADHLLKEIYQIINQSLNENEVVTRIMADHFGILINEKDSQKCIERIRIWDYQLLKYSNTEMLPIVPHLTYGVYMIDQDDDEVTLLLDKANLARKSINNNDYHKNNIAFYDEALKERVAFQKHLEDHQEYALKNNEFQMYLQPKFNPNENRIKGAEALVRWIDHDGKMIYPDQFIPLFEANGFIMNIDLFIFKEACQFIQYLIDQKLPVIPISVNLSRVNLNHPNFLKEYINVWKEYNFDPALIEFEITENIIYDNTIQLNEIIADIHRNGFLVSMDDFGSGYSSLNMLKTMDVDIVKLDRRFFSDNDMHLLKSTKIVHHMIELAKDLGMLVVCEGVENESQVEFLKKNGCNLIQGYYYSRPVPKDSLIEILKKTN